jgi:tRNA nucleotidyltransferase/poly(A) polymerase
MIHSSTNVSVLIISYCFLISSYPTGKEEVILLIETYGRQIIKKLQEAGYSAYFVGGYVRDQLLNRPIQDIDIATNAKPWQVMALFPNAIPTGIQHGTVTVPLNNFFLKSRHFAVKKITTTFVIRKR